MSELIPGIQVEEQQRGQRFLPVSWGLECGGQQVEQIHFTGLVTSASGAWGAQVKWRWAEGIAPRAAGGIQAVGEATGLPGGIKRDACVLGGVVQQVGGVRELIPGEVGGVRWGVSECAAEVVGGLREFLSAQREAVQGAGCVLEQAEGVWGFFPNQEELEAQE